VITYSVSADVSAIVANVKATQSQVPFAAAKALTMTAKSAQRAEIREMQATFDRPTPWTLNGTFVKPATKQDLTSVVWLKDDRATSGGGAPPDVYLNPEIKGGFRRNKAFETALQRVGALPPGYLVVPGAACPMDAYGNISRGLIVQILSYFRTFDTAGFTNNITIKRRERLKRGTKRRIGFEYFVAQPADGKLPLGIWQRFQFAQGSAIKPIFLFVSTANYKARFRFEQRARETFDAEFTPNFIVCLREAMATAR
jgi:hypothetical protein